MMIGSYVDSYYEGTLNEFRTKNPHIFRKDGKLLSGFQKAEDIIARTERDELFQKYMSGQKQVIMTAELFGVPWKIKMDSYLEDKAIVDLKVMASDEWVLADDQNCPELGGETTFGFGDAYKFLERGLRVTKKSWHKAGMFLTMQRPDEHSKMTAPYVYITIDGDYRVPWHPSQADMSEKDWVLYEEE